MFNCLENGPDAAKSHARRRARGRGKRTFGASALDTLTQWLKLYEHNLLVIDTFIEKTLLEKNVAPKSKCF